MSLLRISLLSAALCGACSTTPGLTLLATPTVLPGDGETTATVTASVTRGGSPVDGAEVKFKTTLGTFKEAEAGTPDLATVMSSGGAAVATLIAPRQGFGTITVTASVSLDGVEPSKTVTVPLSPRGGPAAALSFTCQHQNIGAMVQSRLTTIHVLCTASAYDSANKLISKASVQTLSEAGDLTWLKDQDGVQQFVYSVRPDSPKPKDVGPIGADGQEHDVCPQGCVTDPFGPSCVGEPCWTDVTGPTHNPRDGIATLIAALPGVKGFDDQGEPYVDSNDNGKHDPGEPFIDYNGNGKWDGPDGTIKDHMIWKAFRIIWSGEASFSATSHTVHDSGIKVSGSSVTAYLVDRNLNALAADGPASSDGVTLTSTCSNPPSNDCAVTFASGDIPMDQIHPGVLFKADDGSIILPQERATWTRNINYDVRPAVTGTKPISVDVFAQAHRLYDPGAPGYEAEGSNPDVGVGATFGY